MTSDKLKSVVTVMSVVNGTSVMSATSLSIRPSYGARGEEILDGGGGRGRRERKA